MEIQRAHSIYFSPSGSTKQVSEALAKAIFPTGDSFDLLQCPSCLEGVRFTPYDVVVVGMPVFAGRIPSTCAKQLLEMQGESTPAVIVAVYGNREYDDALVEMEDILVSQGFVVQGAAAVVARHSIFPEVAKGRPDAKDMEELNAFGLVCATTIKNHIMGVETVSVKLKGNRPYRVPGSVPLKPAGNDLCISCGLCARLCPVGAIDSKTPRKTNKALCITCMACIYHCPQQARSLSGLKYTVAKKGFTEKHSQPKPSEWFV